MDSEGQFVMIHLMELMLMLFVDNWDIQITIVIVNSSLQKLFNTLTQLRQYYKHKLSGLCLASKKELEQLNAVHLNNGN